MSKKWRVCNVKDGRKIEVKQTLPQLIWCDPDKDQFPLDSKHQFEATKLYLISDSQGQESGIVICPTHILPIPVTPIHRRPQSGDGKPA